MGHKQCSFHVCNRLLLLNKSSKILINSGYRRDQQYLRQFRHSRNRKLLKNNKIMQTKAYEELRKKLISPSIACYIDTNSKGLSAYDEITIEKRGPARIRKTKNRMNEYHLSKGISCTCSSMQNYITNSIVSGLKDSKYGTNVKQNIFYDVQRNTEHHEDKLSLPSADISDEIISERNFRANKDTTKMIKSQMTKINRGSMQRTIYENYLKKLRKPVCTELKFKQINKNQKIIWTKVKNKKSEEYKFDDDLKMSQCRRNRYSQNINRKTRANQKHALVLQSLRKKTHRELPKYNDTIYKVQLPSGETGFVIRSIYSDSNAIIKSKAMHVFRKRNKLSSAKFNPDYIAVQSIKSQFQEKIPTETVSFFTIPECFFYPAVHSTDRSRKSEANNEMISLGSVFSEKKGNIRTHGNKNLSRIKFNFQKIPSNNLKSKCSYHNGCSNNTFTKCNDKQSRRTIEYFLHEIIPVSRNKWFHYLSNYKKRYLSFFSEKFKHKSTKERKENRKCSNSQSQLSTSLSLHDCKSRNSTDSSIVNILFKVRGSEYNNLKASKTSLANVKNLKKDLPHKRRTDPICNIDVKSNKKYPTKVKNSTLIFKLKKYLHKFKPYIFFKKHNVKHSIKSSKSKDSAAVTPLNEGNTTAIDCILGDLVHCSKKNIQTFKSLSSSDIPNKNKELFCYVATNLCRNNNWLDYAKVNVKSASSSRNAFESNDTLNDIIDDQYMLQYYSALKRNINSNVSNLRKSATKAELVEKILFPTDNYIDKAEGIATTVTKLNDDTRNYLPCSRLSLSSSIKNLNSVVKYTDAIKSSGKETIGSQTIRGVLLRPCHRFYNSALNLKYQKDFQFIVEGFGDSSSIINLLNKNSLKNIMTTCSLSQFPSKSNLRSGLGKLQCFEMEQYPKPPESNVTSKVVLTPAMTGITKYLKTNFVSLNLENKKGMKLGKYECEPGFCIVDECDPAECLKRINQRNVKKRDQSTGGKSNKRDKKKKIKNGPMEDKEEYPSEYIVEEPRALKSIVQNLAPGGRRKAVKIGSRFSFDIEFYKEIKDGICFSQPKQGYQRPRQQQQQPPPQQRKQQEPPSVKRGKKRHLKKQQSTGTVTETREYKDTGTHDEGPFKQHRDTQAGREQKESGVGPVDKCICSAKLQTKHGRQKGTGASTTTMSTHAEKHTGMETSKYACDKGLCTTGLCDRKKCKAKKYGTKPSLSSVGSLTLRAERGSIGSVTLAAKRAERGVKPKKTKVRSRRSKPVESMTGQKQYKSRGIQKPPAKKVCRPDCQQEREQERRQKRRQEFEERPGVKYVQRYNQPLQRIVQDPGSSECSGKHQGVKLGSSFDFNVQFSRGSTSDPMSQPVYSVEPDFSDDDYRNQYEGQGRYEHNERKKATKVEGTMTNPIKRCFCTLKFVKNEKRGKDSEPPINKKNKKPEKPGKAGRTLDTAAYFCKCRYGSSYTDATKPYKHVYQIRRNRYLPHSKYHSLVNFTYDSSLHSIRKSGHDDVSFGFRASINCDPLSCFEFSESSSCHSIVTILPYRSKKHKKQRKVALIEPENKKTVKDQSTVVQDTMGNVDPKTITINMPRPTSNAGIHYNRPYITIAYDKINIKIYTRHTRIAPLNITRLRNMELSRQVEHDYRQNNNVPVVTAQSTTGQLSGHGGDLETRAINNSSVQLNSSNTTLTICIDNENSSHFKTNPAADNSTYEINESLPNAPVFHEIIPIQIESETNTTGLLDKILNDSILKNNNNLNDDIQNPLRKSKSDSMSNKPCKNKIKRR